MHIAASLRASGSALSCWRWSFRDPPPKGDIVGVRDEQVPAGYEPLLVPVMLGGRPTGANGDLAAARVRLGRPSRAPARDARALQDAQPPPVRLNERLEGLRGRVRVELLRRDRSTPASSAVASEGTDSDVGDDRSCQAFGPGSGGASYPLPTGAPASLSPPASRTLTGLRRAVTGRLERLRRAVTGRLERLLGPLGERVGRRKLPLVPLLDLVPRSFGEYEAAGGGRGLQTALTAWPVAVIQEVARSGLRGRGGAGFPTGEKWRAVRAVGAGPRFAVGNAAEGEPATFKDRLLLRTNPYQVLEGLAIAAYAVGAEHAYIGLKETFTAELQALTRALREMREADALGGVPIDLVLGPDLYLFGEETGLEEVIEGRPPLPRVARPFIQGLFARPPADNPTLVNNVETLANVPHVLAEGPDWLRANGTEAAPGTMVFTICGDVRREGVFELPLGSQLRYLVEELAGGPPEGRAIKAIFPGASNTVILPEQLDLPLDFDSVRQAGSGLGAGGFAVFDDSACMVQAAWRYSRFLYVEACGQCPACKFGTGEVTQTLAALEAGAGSDRDLELILVRARGSTGGQKCALPTGESLLMQSLVQAFGEEFASHIGRSCPLPRELPFHKLVDWDATAGRFAYDLAYADRQPDWTSPS